MPTIAIVGASSDRNKFGNKAVRGYVRQGWTVHPVNPRGGEIEGLPVARSLREVPGPVDRIALYVPPEIGSTLLDDVAALEHGDLIVNPGAESPELFARAARLGLHPRAACALIEVGLSPAQL